MCVMTIYRRTATRDTMRQLPARSTGHGAEDDVSSSPGEAGAVADMKGSYPDP